MRNFLAVASFTAMVALAGDLLQAEETFIGVSVAEAASPQALTLELIQAHHDYQLAKFRRHEYRFVTLPQQRRALDNQIKFAEAEIAILHRRLRDYRPFLQVGRYSPVQTAAENHRLALIAAEQRLGQFKAAQVGLLRLTRQRNQLYQLDVLRAATRFAQARRALELRQTGGGDAPAR